MNIRLPEDKGRMKGFGYAEFIDKATLIEALTLNDSVSYLPGYYSFTISWACHFFHLSCHYFLTEIIDLQMLRNRKVRIDLAEQTGDQGRDSNMGRGGRRDHDDDGEDRTLGDWRRKPPGDGGSSFGGTSYSVNC